MRQRKGYRDSLRGGPWGRVLGEDDFCRNLQKDEAANRSGPRDQVAPYLTNSQTSVLILILPSRGNGAGLVVNTSRSPSFLMSRI